MGRFNTLEPIDSCSCLFILFNYWGSHTPQIRSRVHIKVCAQLRLDWLSLPPALISSKPPPTTTPYTVQSNRLYSAVSITRGPSVVHPTPFSPSIFRKNTFLRQWKRERERETVFTVFTIQLERGGWHSPAFMSNSEWLTPFFIWFYLYLSFYFFSWAF